MRIRSKVHTRFQKQAKRPEWRTATGNRAIRYKLADVAMSKYRTCQQEIFTIYNHMKTDFMFLMCGQFQTTWGLALGINRKYLDSPINYGLKISRMVPSQHLAGVWFIQHSLHKLNPQTWDTPFAFLSRKEWSTTRELIMDRHICSMCWLGCHETVHLESHPIWLFIEAPPMPRVQLTGISLGQHCPEGFCVRMNPINKQCQIVSGIGDKLTVGSWTMHLATCVCHIKMKNLYFHHFMVKSRCWLT